MRAVLSGNMGSGVGMQRVLLSERLRIPSIALGGAVRAAVDADTEPGRRFRAVADRGEPVDDTLLVDILAAHLVRDDTRDGFLLDDVPASVDRAWLLDQRLDHAGIPLDTVVALDVPLEILIRRYADSPDAGARRARIEAHARCMRPVLDYYRNRARDGRLRYRVVSGLGSTEQVYARILDALR
ncbi:adenylate kinase family protein [Nocardia sp. NPDC050406]|uniref:adenylate kinase family protein n=1 Tax=Nocardia sp. NPDC050406 TaxID=3364318 RepID=UPI0037B6A1A0